MSKIDELLTVLDMSKAEQYGWAVDKYPEYLAKYPQKSLADLAFRLRDKLDADKFQEGMLKVFGYIYEYSDDAPYSLWFCSKSCKPICWIIATLIAEELKGRQAGRKITE